MNSLKERALSARMKMRTATIISGWSLLIVATATIPALPWVAIASSLGCASCGLLLKRFHDSQASDVADLCRFVMLSACGSVLAMELFSSQPALEFGRAHLAPMIENLFFNFEAFIIGYVVVCSVLFVAIMGSQSEQRAEQAVAADRPKTDAG